MRDKYLLDANVFMTAHRERDTRGLSPCALLVEHEGWEEYGGFRSYHHCKGYF